MSDSKEKQAKKIDVQVFNWNVDMYGIRETPEAIARDPQSAWKKRRPHVEKHLRETKADLIALQEIKDIGGVNSREFLGSFAPRYDNVCMRHCGYSNAHSIAVLYNCERFHLRKATLVPLGKGTPTNSLSMLVCRFWSLEVDAEFLFCCAHLSPHGEKCAASVDTIEQAFHGIPADLPVILAGDFNFFDDTPEGPRSRQRMLSIFKEDVSIPLLSADGTVLAGDFLGYGSDAFARTAETMGALCGIYVRGPISTTDFKCETPVHDENLKDRSGIGSDHIPFVRNLRLIPKPAQWFDPKCDWTTF